MARVLLVCSDPAARTAVLSILREKGHETVDLGNRSEAIAALDWARFDLAIVWARLDDGDGVLLLTELRDRFPTVARVFVSESMRLSLVVRAVNQAQPQQVISAPVRPKRLLRAVDQALTALQSAVDTSRRTRDSHGRERLVRLLASSDFTLALQPIVTASGHPAGFEGFMRSRDPVLSTPIEILDFAEQHGILDMVAQAVVQRARAWLEALPTPHRLFLNLHPGDLADPHRLVGQLAPLAPWTGQVVLEITGRAHTAWPRDLRERLHPLRAAGYDVALDDLGSGDGALTLLAEARPRYIKAHGSIVRGVQDSRQKQRLVDMLCRFATGTQAQLIAEGVERESEAAVLRRAGVPLLQGYLFGQPSTDPDTVALAAVGG